MVDSNEKLQSQLNETPHTAFEEKPQDGAGEIEKKELNKRALVEQEIEEHPIFKSMQNVVRNTNVSIMVEAIVDRYFDLTTERNTLDNQEFYQVNDDIVLMALQQTAYLISAEENGIVFDEYGELDTEESNRQKRMAVYSQQLKEKLLPDDRKEVYKDILDNMDNKEQRQAIQFLRAYTSKDFSKADELLRNLMNQNTPLQKDEWKQVSQKINEDETLKANQEESKGKLFFYNKAEYFVTLNAMKYAITIHSTNADENKLAGFLQEIKKWDTEGKFIDPETGKVSADKALEHAKEYHAEYAKRANYEEVYEFCETNTDFNEMDSRTQKNILSSIYSLYNMPPSPERTWALIAMQRISPGTVIEKGKTVLINENEFVNLYNSTGKSNLTFEKIEAEISRRDIRLTLNHMQSIKKRIKEEKFEDIEIPPGATPEQAKMLQKELRKEIHKGEKPKFKQSDDKKFEKAIDKIIKTEKIQGNREELVIAAYRLLQRRAKNDPYSHYTADSEYVKEHIEGLVKVYGNYLDGNKITRKALAVQKTQSSDIEKIVKGIEQFRRKEENLQEKKFSLEHIKENWKNTVDYLKNGITYAGTQTKNLFISMFNIKPVLPEGNAFERAYKGYNADFENLKAKSEERAENKAAKKGVKNTKESKTNGNTELTPRYPDNKLDRNVKINDKGVLANINKIGENARREKQPVPVTVTAEKPDIGGETR